MDDRVIPICLTSVNWKTFLGECQALLGRSPARGVDASMSKLSDFAKFTASLGEFRSQEANARTTLRTPGPWLDHTFYSFLISTSAPTILEITESTPLNVMSVQSGKVRVAVVSGTLNQWRSSIIIGCSESVKTRTRVIFNTIKVMFDQLGLRDVWFEYKLKSLTDKTFSLEYKP